MDKPTVDFHLGAIHARVDSLEKQAGSFATKEELRILGQAMNEKLDAILERSGSTAGDVQEIKDRLNRGWGMGAGIIFVVGLFAWVVTHLEALRRLLHL